MMCGYDVVYINTVMVIDYILAACVLSRPRVIHIHEIPTGLAPIFFSALLINSRAFLIFNSLATRRTYTVPFWQHSVIVLNGVAAPLEPRPAAAHAHLNLLLIGRFNSLKGQPILLRAIAQLPIELRARLRVRLVGSVYGDQVHFTERVVNLVEELGIAEIVELFPFTPNPQPHFCWADIVVVPSTKPESFSLVAIEGMAAGCSVIASNHGGVAEIVVDGETGTLVEPGSMESLAAAITRYLDAPALVSMEGNAGRKRFVAEFEESHYLSKIANIIAELTETNVA
jgi:glycosyltransferase involved in cell wall biosynthesis